MSSKIFKAVTATSIMITSTMPLGLVAFADEVEPVIESEETITNNESSSEEVSKEQIIVKYKDEIVSSIPGEQVEELGGEVVTEEENVALYNVPEENIEETIEKLGKIDGVEFVEKNVSYSIAATDDTYYENQWNLSAIAAQEAWRVAEKQEGNAVVAVLDTGVQGFHEDLDGRVLSGKTFVDGYEETFEGDDQGHGTFVSGIIAANADNGKGIAGVAGDADVQILPVKVMNKSGVGDAFNIAKGIDYAVAQGVDVINLSFSGEYSESIEQAINKAVAAGIVVVAASGNGGGNADTSYPAALPNVLSVGAIAAKDQVYSRSNYGSTLDLVAPGVSVLSTALSGDLGDENGFYKTGSGTSYAAPHVAAVAALYKMQNSDASSSEVEQALISTATDLNEEGWDEKTGYGKLNAAAALAGEVDIEPLTFTLPKANASVIGKTTVQVALNDTEDVDTTKFYVDAVEESNLIGEVKGNEATVSMEWDTSTINDGEHEIIAVTYNADGTPLSENTRKVTVRNEAQSGYMFSVKTPNNTVAQGAEVQLFEKVIAEDGTYSYSSLWTGATNSEGVVRVPSHIGTDLKTLEVVVQGKFDAEDGNAWFMYSREVSDIGTVELASENTKAVSLQTLDENSENVAAAQYFVSMKDEDGVEITGVKQINEENAKQSPTIYLDKGAYNLYSYYKQEENTYFLKNTDAVVTNETSSLTFDSREAGAVSVDNSDDSLENAVLYLYDDVVSEIFGSSEVLTGQNFFVTEGEYDYIIDAEVKDSDGGENWIYVFTNDKNKATVNKGEKTSIKAGGSLEISEFLPDQESLKRYYKQRGLTYIERESPYTGYKLDGAIYTKQVFSDTYGNMLAGMYRGSVEPTNALYKKNVITGETIIMDEENEVAAFNFGDIYPIYQVKRKSDDAVMLNSYDKNPTNPANRNYYFYSFWVPTSSKVTNGEYEISLKLDPSPLAPNGLFEAMTIDMQDSGVNLTLQDADEKNVATYVTINRVEKDEHGEYNWVQAFGRNSDSSTKVLSIPSNLEVSKEEGGNVAIIRYLTSKGEFGYLFRQFTDLEELSETITIPANMQKVSFSAMAGEEKLDGISSKLWMIKQPVTVNGTTLYPTANNLQTYKKDAVYLEPGSFVIEGNYVTLPNVNGEKSNYYFLEKDVEIKENIENEVIFDTKDLAEVTIDADTEGFKDVRGAIVYPYNEYSTAFTKTLRVGHKFYVPADLEMELQVQLGYGDEESNNYIWNYFLNKGTQVFKAEEKVNWKVGGNFNTSISLEGDTLKKGEALSAKTAIQDAYGNSISSVLVNKTNDYSIADDQEIVYERLGNGQIVERIVSKESGQYIINHSIIPEASAESVKPFVRIYDETGKKVLEKSSLDFYQSVENLPLSLDKGKYRAELAMASSPKGPIVSSEEEGIFSVEGNSSTGGGSSSGGNSSTGGGSSSSGGGSSTEKPSVEQPDEKWSNETLTATMSETDNGFSFTFTEEQIEAITSSNSDKVTLSTSNGLQIQISTADFKKEYADTLTVGISLKDTKLTFEAKENEQSVILKDFVSILLPKEMLSTDLNQAVVLRVGEKGFESVPHVVTNEGIVLKTKQSGQFTISEKAISFADIAKDPHKQYIEALAKRYIVQGKSAAKFDPNGNMTRAQFAAMVARALDLKTTSSSTFKDVKGMWYENDVQALYEAGIVFGIDSTTFKPNATINRIQAAMMLSRLLDYVKADVENVNLSSSTFKDVSNLNAEAKEVVTRMQALNIFAGKKDGSFAPYEQLTRSQMAKTLYKSLQIAGML